MSMSRQAFAEARFAQPWTPSRFERTRATRLTRQLAQRAAGPLLDLGCYDRHFIARVVDTGDWLVGVDVSPGALRAAAARRLSPVRAQVQAGLPFQTERFATVAGAEVIKHILDTERFLGEAARVLKSGGWLAITTPNLVALSGRGQLLLGHSPDTVEFDASPGTSGHIQHFTFGTLECLLKRAGLQPRRRWTNVAHCSGLGSSERLGRLRPELGHALISVSRKA